MWPSVPRSWLQQAGVLPRLAGFRFPLHSVIPSLRSQEDTSCFEPKVISIGPLHRGNESLRAMEEHKWRYLRDVLSRSPVDNLEKCIVAVGARVPDIRGQYSDWPSVGEIAAEELVEMMVLDGCFILELLIKYVSDEVDPTLSTSLMGATTLLHVDLLLLENQIPFFVLEALLEAMAPRPFKVPLVDMVFLYLSFKKFRNLQETGFANFPPRIFHLLHLNHVLLASTQPPTKERPSSCWRATQHGVRKMGRAVPSVGRRLLASAAACRVFKCGGASSSADGRRAPEASTTLLSLAIPSATKLREAGIKIERRALGKGFLPVPDQVRFARGTLALPTMSLSRLDYSVLRNFVTFEQCCPEWAGSGLTCYAYLMTHLMRTERDVELLRRCGVVVVVNDLGSVGDVLLYFQNAHNGGAFHGGFRYVDLIKSVHKYCDSL